VASCIHVKKKPTKLCRQCINARCQSRCPWPRLRENTNAAQDSIAARVLCSTLFAAFLLSRALGLCLHVASAGRQAIGPSQSKQHHLSPPGPSFLPLCPFRAIQKNKAPSNFQTSHPMSLTDSLEVLALSGLFPPKLGFNGHGVMSYEISASFQKAFEAVSPQRVPFESSMALRHLGPLLR
jgi:hypothetical protein